jgi:L-asparaginase
MTGPGPRPRVAVVFTGGTISMQRDPDAGGNVPSLDGAALLAMAPGIEAIAELVPIDLGRVPASWFSLSRLLEIGDEIRRVLSDPEVSGVVVVQGTDAIEETAFLWDLIHDDARPVVVTGAMLPASHPAPDGPDNLENAVRAAGAPALRGAGVVVSLAGTIEAADTVIKRHATALDTFGSVDAPPLGHVGPDGVRLARPRGPRRHVATATAAEPVVLLKAHVGMDGALVDAARGLEPRGIVIEAAGAGNSTPDLLAAATRAMDAGIPVVLTTRCPAGAPVAEYAFPGGGATWVRAGAILAGHLGGPKARIALALGLGAGLDAAGLAALLADPA